MGSPLGKTLSVSTIFTSLLLIPQLVSALQVTPNSPCASICQDSSTVDVSDPNSSTTLNSDIVCEDAKYSTARGTKFKDCMTCLQGSGFSQGSESDVMWFLYNARYAASYCIFGYPNATDVGSSPCTTIKACGMLTEGIQHGISDQRGMTAYSYCSAGNSEAMDPANFEACRSCVSAERKKHFLTNYLVALEAGCTQQPAPGVPLGLNETIFSDHTIAVVDPASSLESEKKKSGPGTTTLVGIAAGAVVGLLVIAAVTFVCVRKRKNRINRASAQADFFRHFGQRPESSVSFQCQTHSMLSPRLWPAAAEGMSPIIEDPNQISFQKQEVYGYAPHQGQIDSVSGAPIAKKAAVAAIPLHSLTTSIPPAEPPQAYAPPYASATEKAYYSPSDFKSPLSADSVRSTSALLPAIKPYIPAEYAAHGSPVPLSATTFNSPTSGTGMTPLLKSHPWPEQKAKPSQPQQQEQKRNPQRPIIKLTTSDTLPPPPGPPPTKPGRNSVLAGGGIGLGLTVKKEKTTPTGSPVESVEIKTAFKAPPRR